MNTPPKDPLDRLLNRWTDAGASSVSLKAEVWQRIGRFETAARPFGRGRVDRWEVRWARPALALLVGAVCVLGALLVTERRSALRQSRVNAELARQYLRLIDPLRNEPISARALDRELVWLRDQLRLSPEQFSRIKALHEASGPELIALAQQVVRMKRELAALETQRRTADQVDFLAVAELAETQRVVDRECADSTRKLVRAAATVMTPEQRQRYLRYVQAELPPASPSVTD